MDNCNCATRIRYILPCPHQIQLGVPIQVTQVHLAGEFRAHSQLSQALERISTLVP
ncbi:hypothetical protein LIPSTDRAFT_69474 [Lipomyces starkeyi NRRL Y-11557]|uniref:Uncharacterized protein n=1 Tax=Lipomyces starkeyi NRRL Y-11557 TaxID=675824 RepID=A0A1E3QC72_LIPST|nr:hypothetical protein LIPSTDRAFT_69474 [Lipomyces starkeyi NRRL Y-11557]